MNCTKCNAHIVNIVMIGGKPYGQDCAMFILGIPKLPAWFSVGDWDKAKEKHESEQADFKAIADGRINSLRENWDFIKRFSIAFVRARREDNFFAIKFLADMAIRHGIQFAKETAHEYDSFEDFIAKERKNGWPEMFKSPVLSEKQLSLLEKMI